MLTFTHKFTVHTGERGGVEDISKKKKKKMLCRQTKMFHHLSLTQLSHDNRWIRGAGFSAVESVRTVGLLQIVRRKTKTANPTKGFPTMREHGVQSNVRTPFLLSFFVFNPLHLTP